MPDPHPAKPRAYRPADARVGLLTTLTVVVGLALVRPGWNWPDERIRPDLSWSLLLGVGLVVAVLRVVIGVSVLPMLMKALGLLPFVTLIVAPLAWSRPNGEGLSLAAMLLTRALLSVSIVGLLVDVYGLPAVLVAAQRLGVPGPLVMAVAFLDRYRRVLAEEAHRMMLAEQSRTFRPFRRGLRWWLSARTVAVLLERSIARSERVHSAMLARGFDGRFRSADCDDTAPSQPSAQSR